MRKRMLHTSIWGDKKVVALSLQARLLYVGLITHSDDDGRFNGDPALIRSSVFPRDTNISVEDVQKWRDEIVASGLIVLYSNNDDEYIAHPKWTKYQNLRVDRRCESKIPAPEGWVRPEDEIVLPNNPSLPRKLAIAVYERDGSQCRYCGKTEKPFHIDHVIPESNGGETILSNLVVSCQKCNTSKKDRTIEEMGWILRPFPTFADKARAFVSQMPAEDKISKVSKGKVINTAESFEKFWSLYPKKTAKQACVRAWTRLAPSPALVETILKDVESRSKTESWQKEGGQFIPFPATYLNGARWEDELGRSSSKPPVVKNKYSKT